MVVYHFCNDDGSYQVCINASVRPTRYRVMVRHKYQTKLAVNVNGVLLIPIANELMTAERRSGRNL